MSEKPVLLQIGSVTERMRARLEAEFEIHKLFEQEDRAAFLAQVGPSVTAIVTDGHWGVPEDVMAACPELKVVSSYGVGYDAIDAEGAAQRGILVSHTPDVLNDEVADTAILLWLGVSRRVVPADRWARSGDWEARGAFPLTRSVQGRTMGILGLGRIGQTIAERAQAFGAKILYHSRAPKPVDFTYCADLVEMARQSDVLVCITPGGAATRHLVNAQVLEALGPEGILVNVSRGSVVDEAALVAALESGALGGAGLDVFEAEPKIPDALKAMDNVLLTPHVGSATVETRQAMGDLTCDNLSRFLKDGTVLTPVPECKALNG
ncbi:Glyoxylate/hydroxypyruvate reductase B [Pseudoruegeria aquimaris]|uniref:Glyoxylate/hydroxypyruvate reductase B n=1 Tax=Pseudoruegeria aquimaris TaxID=393663 RepID=A0A1Y5T1U1_9RHOB|nr:2-hydroxyacid dehydrogenase [Pseudoruegeria aquimaris]SLN54000.1 Glyoxylate/hydroxypyruvate reductase B [Pseudoruegeria aquimaris]